ncbi:MAG: redoxin domain-containing protein [Planctomycetia bacterium]|nr:redoxin domain-containing protein [Planctomycetia bacterium]
MRNALTLLALAAVAAGSSAQAAAPSDSLNKKVADFKLNDFHGQPYNLADSAKGKIVVVAFLGTECPLAKLYAPRLAELAKEFEPKGVVFVGVNANRQDSVTEISSYARVHDIQFPILKDLNQAVADQLGATRTPEVIVLDADRKIRYRGRIDDQYGLVNNAGYQRKEPSRRDLAVALDELLAGKAVSQPQTEPGGCLIGRDRKPVAGSDVTYSKQIARILNDNCVSCHRTGQIAPFTLTSYDEVVGWAGMIDEVVQGGRMPPWHADPQYGHFKNDARLSDADKAAIAKWVANGAPEGNPKDLPEPPKFAEGWMIAEPDQVIYMADKGFDVPATGVVDYQMFTVDPGWKEDKWISAIEPRPGNPAVVHHILIFVLTPDGGNLGLLGGNDFTGAFAPGLRPEPLPEGMARLVPAGSKLIFQMHYTPNGSAQADRSFAGIKFADPKTVKREVVVNSAANFVIQIPPGVNDYHAQSRWIFKKDTLLLTLMPHMHLRGKAFRYEATYPDGKKEVLLSVPRYDFGWQTNYRLVEPKLLPMGTRLDCFAEFDNSEDNLNNPDPKATVGFGDQTFEEMMIGFFEAADPNQDLTDPKAAEKVRKLSRVEEFLVIMRATGGDPDDNLKAGTHLALSDPEWFAKFSMILPVTVPQVDRVCLTAIVDGKLVQKFGPFQRQRPGAKPEDLPETLRSPLAEAPVEGEPLAAYAAGDKPVINPDLTKVKGAVFAKMVARGAKSSMHVPIEVGGVRATINFWSTDADAFPQPAVQLLSALSKAMAAPKPNQQAAAR